MATRNQDSDESLWQKTSVTNLVRYQPSGVYFARVRVGGKLNKKSLKTKTLTVAKLRLADYVKGQRQLAESTAGADEAKMTVGDAIERYQKDLESDTSLKPRTKEHRRERIGALRRTWPDLEGKELRKISKQDCLNWAASLETGAINFNKTVQVLRGILEIAVDLGIRYGNPARHIKSRKVTQKPLRLPTRDQFNKLVKSIRDVNKRFSQDAAVLVEFLAYGGFRISEAANVTWADCDLDRKEIIVRGDPETGTKNWSIRKVPMIPEMMKLLERIRPDDLKNQSAPVMKVKECRGALATACEREGIPKLTHHDLRHLFATTCIEAAVDIPTVSRWLGHKDGGALAMKTYGHLRDEHSKKMAEKVSYASGEE